jgi:hypothetical protein
MSDLEPFPADLDIKSHVRLAQMHANAAKDLAYGSQPQSMGVRRSLGKAQSILISLLTNNKLK